MFSDRGSTPLVSTTSERTLLRSDFSFKKNQSHAPSFLLFRKKARSARLFACKRAHNGSLSLPPFCECACGANVSAVRQSESCKPYYLGLAAFLYTIFTRFLLKNRSAAICRCSSFSEKSHARRKCFYSSSPPNTVHRLYCRCTVFFGENQAPLDFHAAKIQNFHFLLYLLQICIII